MDSCLQKSQPGGKWNIFIWRGYINQLSELFIEVENKLFSTTLPGSVQGGGGDRNSSETACASIVVGYFLPMFSPYH